MHYIAPEDRTQCSLFTSLDDMIKDSNPVRLLDVIVESIVSSNRDQLRTKGQEIVGRKAYSPEALLKLYMSAISTVFVVVVNLKLKHIAILK